MMLTALCMLVVAIAAVRMVLSPAFQDSLGQCVALAGVTLGALGLAWSSWRYGATAALEFYAVSQALFTVASIVKR